MAKRKDPNMRTITLERFNELIQRETVLIEISEKGKGMKDSMIDWERIGKNSVLKAQEAMKFNCPTCGSRVWKK